MTALAKSILVVAFVVLSSCVGISDDPVVGQEQEELRYSCGSEGDCYCCYDNDAYGGCCMCPVGGARCR